jgi:acetyl-CoA synthetase (ADP-forming)/acetyltransferase
VQAKARFVLVFTSGFSEVGDKQLEDDLLAILDGSGTRMIGPNCVGAHCPERGLIYYPQVMRETPGDVGFFSQSGGHALNFLMRGLSMGIEFNKVISVGNQADVKIADFIEYFAHDAKIKFICGYIEDIKDQGRFQSLVADAILRKKKPVVLWKGGRSEDGARAAQSHTGAMAVPAVMWDSIMGQMGIINAETQDEMLDIMLAFKHGFRPAGLRACVTVAGGGSSVELTDALNQNGVSVPVLSPDIQAMIGEGISQVNTSTRNPIDLGMFGFAPDILVRSVECAAQDPNIDFIIVCQYLEIIYSMLKDLWDVCMEKMITGLSKISKPIILLMPQIIYNRADVAALHTSFVRRLNSAGILYYTDAGRVARMAVKMYRYLQYLERHPVRP